MSTNSAADRATIRDALVERYLPEPFWRRIPASERWWRGRTILLLRALGYPLEMAWSYGVNAEGEDARDLQGWVAQLDDARLVGQLDATAEVRGDGGHLEFVSFGIIRSDADSRPPVS